jgi:phosphoribosylglycinamide formyltransferase-1
LESLFNVVIKKAYMVDRKGTEIDMNKQSGEDRRLLRLTEFCLSLPESIRQLSGSHASFLVRKKVFAYVLDNHHGDGIVSVTCKVLPGDNKALVASFPSKFYLPAYIGSRGWVALRLDLRVVDWDEVSELVLTSYRLIAPKRLIALLKADDLD